MLAKFVFVTELNCFYHSLDPTAAVSKICFLLLAKFIFIVELNSEWSIYKLTRKHRKAFDQNGTTVWHCVSMKTVQFCNKDKISIEQQHVQRISQVLQQKQSIHSPVTSHGYCQLLCTVQ